MVFEEPAGFHIDHQCDTLDIGALGRATIDNLTCWPGF